jgi:hypothetical protein
VGEQLVPATAVSLPFLPSSRLHPLFISVDWGPFPRDTSLSPQETSDRKSKVPLFLDFVLLMLSLPDIAIRVHTVTTGRVYPAISPSQQTHCQQDQTAKNDKLGVRDRKHKN